MGRAARAGHNDESSHGPDGRDGRKGSLLDHESAFRNEPGRCPGEHVPTARRLLEVARTPAAMAALATARIDALVSACTFHQANARQIRALAQRVAAMGGELPCDFDVLTSFSGVGPKCANLALGIACGAMRISVDVHVHRVTNRWGYVLEYCRQVGVEEHR